MALSRESSPALFEPPSSPPPLPPSYSRKRSRSPTLHDHSQGSSSSDAFVFSSDDAPEGLENYEIPNRKKRQYVGTWWAHEDKPARSPKRRMRPRAKRKLSRNNDSGVWLSSESSDDSAIERLAAAPHPLLFGSVPRAQQPQNLPADQDNSVGHARADEKIQECLEEGKEMVDLSGMCLRSIPDEIVQPLAQLIKNPRVGAEVPNEDSYQSFTPSLQLFLSRNELRTVPMAVWNLENLTVLSLRNNKLTEIPPAIANLKNLKELNLAGNKLRWLPWELLRLVAPNGELASLNVSPNRFLQGGNFTGTLRFSDDQQQMLKNLCDLRAALDDPEQAASHEQIAWSIRLYETLLRRMETRDPTPTPRNECPAWKKEPVFITSTPVARMNFDGSLQSKSPARPSRVPLETSHMPAPGAGHTPAKDLSNLPNKTRVPSLFELALRSAAGTSKPHTLRNLLSDESPSPVIRGLEEMERVLNAGGQTCSICSKPYIQPGAEWVEYWHYADTLVCRADDSFLPFLRRACSLGCAVAVNGGEVQE
ncbi:uncharacterized protein IWZ02DRAFT_437149 [Phyllosticta citriasiana]|uniref:uncharacterized protein n=1 Tax=Phyllosticta citriasiana TaxID=595635 RepID=UPI0030FDC24C